MKNKWGLVIVLFVGLFLDVQCSRRNINYETVPEVIELTPDNFESVLNDEDLWAVQFYATWCPYCEKLAPEWITASKNLRNEVKMGVVNVPKYQPLGMRYHVLGFPTILVFGDDKSRPTQYRGARTARDITEYLYSMAKRRRK